MNTKDVPAIIMLLAGFLASMFMLRRGVTTDYFVITLLIVLVIFYLIGDLVKFILDKFFNPKPVETVEDLEEAEELEDISIDASEDGVIWDDEEMNPDTDEGTEEE